MYGVEREPSRFSGGIKAADLDFGQEHVWYHELIVCVSQSHTAGLPDPGCRRAREAGPANRQKANPYGHPDMWAGLN